MQTLKKKNFDVLYIEKKRIYIEKPLIYLDSTN